MSQEFTLPRRRRRLRPYLDLTAMIDTVFNLLIFFAVTTTFVGAKSGLPLRLPQAQTAQPVMQQLTITLLPEQPAWVEGEAVAAGNLGETLTRLAQGDLETQVVIDADEKVSYAQLVGVLDEVRLAEFNRIALAAAPAQEPKRTDDP